MAEAWGTAEPNVEQQEHIKQEEDAAQAQPGPAQPAAAAAAVAGEAGQWCGLEQR